MSTPVLFHQACPSPLGQWHLLADADSLHAVIAPNNWSTEQQRWGAFETRSNPVLEHAQQQLQAYFAGQRQDFELPLHLSGTPFQQQVWQSLLSIPYGTTLSYGEQAARVGQASAARAVGRINGQNPLSIIVPCHRVIGKNGHLTGYAGGIEVKRYLLELERHVAASALGLLL